jgi:hypothetical protein
MCTKNYVNGFYNRICYWQYDQSTSLIDWKTTLCYFIFLILFNDSMITQWGLFL